MRLKHFQLVCKVAYELTLDSRLATCACEFNLCLPFSLSTMSPTFESLLQKEGVGRARGCLGACYESRRRAVCCL